MPHVTFTQNLQRHIACPPIVVAGDTVGASLEAEFEAYPKLQEYVLDEQGALRQHVVVFVDGAPTNDRQRLADAVPPTAEIYVMQALSGG